MLNALSDDDSERIKRVAPDVSGDFPRCRLIPRVLWPWGLSR